MKQIVSLILFLSIACSSSSDTMDATGSCSDGLKNGNETGVDCGGDCGSCQEEGVTIPGAGYNAPTSYSEYSLFWSDEFSGSGLDSGKWNYNLGTGCPSLCGWGNSELQTFTNSLDNLYFKDGNLIIEANHDGSKYASARINTDNKFEFQYGRVDIRAAMPSASGTWTALFMLNKDYTISNPGAHWPSGGEIDIMEYLGEDHHDIMGTGHYGTDFPNNHRYNSKHYSSQNGQSFNEAYYVYSIVWEEDKITWLVNDVAYHSITPQITGANGQPYPFNDAFYLIFALSVGGNLPNATPVATSFPDYLIIDYVRVYKKN
ncbi:glycoside hydrolase family 16 protein [Seonamhaeicola sp.]|uniref:glycoside hydrolase family 16 protein n=1 Tax=Seonamhaeicola sp. TaxID=1912245 RepID=UPI00262B505F|nr:glycoside hydrolase family 16 protein [Seonamhaeicola sp.]